MVNHALARRMLTQPVHDSWLNGELPSIVLAFYAHPYAREVSVNAGVRTVDDLGIGVIGVIVGLSILQPRVPMTLKQGKRRQRQVLHNEDVDWGVTNI